MTFSKASRIAGEGCYFPTIANHNIEIACTFFSAISARSFKPSRADSIRREYISPVFFRMTYCRPAALENGSSVSVETSRDATIAAIVGVGSHGRITPSYGQFAARNQRTSQSIIEPPPCLISIARVIVSSSFFRTQTIHFGKWFNSENDAIVRSIFNSGLHSALWIRGDDSIICRFDTKIRIWLRLQVQFLLIIIQFTSSLKSSEFTICSKSCPP